MLACLALAPPRGLSRARLVELLFRDRPDDQARVALRHEFRLLADALVPAGADILKITRDHIVLKEDRVWIDVQDIQRATRDNPSALSLLDGELMVDMEGIEPAFDIWLTSERERLRDGARGSGGQRPPRTCT